MIVLAFVSVFAGISYKNSKYRRYTETCFKFNNSLNKWSYIAAMKIDRRNAACSVFEGKIDVTGGNSVLREVESYDHHENK